VIIADLKPYPVTKDSGVPWLGEVPEHWEVRRLKYVLQERDARSPDGTEQLLRVSQYTGVTQRKRADGGDEPDTRAESLVGYKRVEPSDLVVNIMLAWNGSMGVSSFSGIASPAYCVYRFGASAQPWYFHHLLRSPAYKARIKTVSTGVVESRLRLYTDDLYRLDALLPPLREQATIVQFLDHADRRVRRYIRAKQKLIKLLEEQKQAIIHRAVTRGLDPNVRLKPSGAEWLEDVPEHWALSRVKNEFTCLNHRRVPLSSPERGAMTLRLYDYYGASGVIDKVDDYLFDDELLLIAEDGANLVLRNLRLAIIARGKFWVNNHAHILKPRHGNLEFLADLMEDISYLPWISGAAQPKLTQDRLLSIPIAVPPPGEQDRVMRWVTAETVSLKVAIARARSEIDLLREYRTRLIADVVTGKLDVREVAARLPEEEKESKPFDEVDALADAGEDAEDSDLDAATEEAEA
jgi:type I restriction enzyme S subunit